MKTEAQIRDEIAALQKELEELHTVRPVEVTVLWSESTHFPREGKTYDYAEFERKARSAARDKGTGNGYDKTKFTVLLSSGETITLRCDLAEDDDHGFASVVKSYQRHIAEHPDLLTKETFPGQIGFYSCMNGITV